MSKHLLLFVFLWGFAGGLFAQRNVDFPTEEYFGGGIGYAPTFLWLDLAPNFPFSASDDATSTDTGLLSNLGFTAEEISSLDNYLVLHGAEGFGNVSGHWRVGAYVGLGTQGITRADTTADVRLQIALMTGNASLEYVIPIFSNLEIAAGSLFGISRAIIQITEITSVPLNWEDQYDGSDTENRMVALSGNFFAYQPYIALKLQFLDRAGLRISAGWNMGTLPKDNWKLNDYQRISATSDGNFTAPAIRLMLYLGI